MTGCLKWVIILALLPLALYTLFWIAFGVLVFLGLLAS